LTNPEMGPFLYTPLHWLTFVIINEIRTNSVIAWQL